MNITRRSAAVLAASVVGLAVIAPSSAQADTFSNSYSGSDYLTRPTTLNYGSHSAFKLRVWVTVQGLFVSDRYSIKMYDGSGRLLWSASSQRDRTYDIGGNVRKIVIQRSAAHGATTRWQRK